MKQTKQNVENKLTELTRTKQSVEEKIAELTQTKQNVEKKVSELTQTKQTNTPLKMKNDNRELPNAGGTESNTMPLGMLSILGGIILIVRNRIKNTFQ